MIYKLPPALQPDDVVAITCAARKMTLEELAPAVAVIESWGYKVMLGNTVGKAHHQFGGTDLERATDMQQLLDDPSVKAIFSARGGYGTVRLVDRLDLTKFASQPKWLIGYSDITVLHAHLHGLGIASLHGSMPVNFATNTPEALATLQAALRGEVLHYHLAAHPLNRAGQGVGPLVGGNLSVLQSISASPSDVDTRGKILLLEDLDEYLYHIDRMMVQLDRAGKLAHLAGLVVGGMTDMKDNTVPFGQTAYEIVKQRVAQYSYPVCFDFPAGHVPDNRALVTGATHALQVTPEGVRLEMQR